MMNFTIQEEYIYTFKALWDSRNLPMGDRGSCMPHPKYVLITDIAKDEIHPERYTTYFQSVIVFGKIRIIEKEEEKQMILEILGRRCNANDREGLTEEIKKGVALCLALEMKIESITGKQAIELVNKP